MREGADGLLRDTTRTAQRPLDHGEGKDPKIARAEALTSVEPGAATWDFAPEGRLAFSAPPNRSSAPAWGVVAWIYQALDFIRVFQMPDFSRPVDAA
jgi:hypothetical protein